MLKKRLLTASVLIPIFLWIINYGSWVYTFTVLILLSLAVIEFANIAQKISLRPSLIISLLGLWVIVGCIVVENYSEMLVPVLVLFIVVTLIWHMIDYELGAEQSWQDWSISLMAPIYVGVLGSHLLVLRMLPSGQWMTIIVLSILWVSDTGAYAFGKNFGKNYLVVRTSPNKTWEGLLGGIVSGIAYSVGLFLFLLYTGLWISDVIDLQHMVLIGTIVSLFGLFGDLGISLIKRQANVKDTGKIFLGHGGVLDRIDSWLVAVAVSYYYLYWIALS